MRHEDGPRLSDSDLPQAPPADGAEPRRDDAAELTRLLERTAARDRAAFAEFYRRTAPAVLGTLVRIVRRRSVAEDVLQDVYVQVWERAADFDAHRGRAMTWVLALARYRAIDALRRDRMDLVDPHELADAIDSAGGPSAGDEVHDAAADAMDRRRLARCFAQLSSDQQRTVLLAFQGGRSHPEIATALARPLGSVKSWIRRGLQSLKECMESCSPTPT